MKIKAPRAISRKLTGDVIVPEAVSVVVSDGLGAALVAAGLAECLDEPKPAPAPEPPPPAPAQQIEKPDEPIKRPVGRPRKIEAPNVDEPTNDNVS